MVVCAETVVRLLEPCGSIVRRRDVILEYPDSRIA